MISTLNPSAQQFLDNLNRIGDAMTSAQREVSTGLKITQVSDAPDSISLLLEAHADLASTQQVLTNLGRVKTEVDAGEQALQNAVQTFEQVQTLAAQGATDTQTAAARVDIAQQVDALLQRTVGLAATRIEGRYIFSGDRDQQVPYTYDAAQIPPVSAYGGSASTRQVQSPGGATFTVALTAQQIFDSADPTTNVFTSIESLSTALKNNDSAAIQTSLDGLAKVGEFLNSQLAFYGTAQNQVASATTDGQTLETQLQTEVAGLQDADLAKSILDLTQAQTQQQAALGSWAQLPRKTLFDYIG
ncbi:MAG TPA: flagellin [Bryobacteraceae bacterium]|nr:flagellin [Bryobacteraceae bacterium]